MIILGLGSNVGDRLANLRQALIELKKIPSLEIESVSPVYLSDALLPDNAPTDWDKPHLNLAIRCQTILEPLVLLRELKSIEKLVGRVLNAPHWGPRILDIDILAWDDLTLTTDRLTLPHPGLLERPFALWPLADVAPFWRFPGAAPLQGKTAAELVEKWGSRFSGDAPLHTKQIEQRIDTPQLVGVINVTPDSFSDGGQFTSPEKAIEQAQHLIKTGATILDIGAESTAPQAKPLTQKEEWARLHPILTALKNAEKNFLFPPKISIDTRYFETARLALKMGVDWINDVTGLTDQSMQALLAETNAHCVIMHCLSIPPSRENILPRGEDPVNRVFEWGARHLDELEKAGIARDKMIFDPGIGFGKTPEQSFALIKYVHVFQTLNVNILMGHSRKSYLSLFTACAATERDIETLPISLFLANQPVDYLRVHNTEMCARALRIARALA